MEAPSPLNREGALRRSLRTVSAVVAVTVSGSCASSVSPPEAKLDPNPASPSNRRRSAEIDEWRILSYRASAEASARTIGYSRFRANRRAGGGYRSEFTQRLAWRRDGRALTLVTATTTDEDANGEIAAFSSRRVANGRTEEISGYRAGDGIRVERTLPQDRRSESILPPATLGPIGARRVLTDALRNAGDSVSITVLRPGSGIAVTELVEIIAVDEQGFRLRVTTAGVTVERSVDRGFRPIASRVALLGGQLDSNTSTRRAALQAARSPPPPIEIAVVKPVGGVPRSRDRAEYRVRLPRGMLPDAKGLFDAACVTVLRPVPEHELRDRVVRIRVVADANTAESRRLSDAESIAYLSPTAHLEANDPAIVRRATALTAELASDWKRALRLAEWVRGYLDLDPSALAFGSAKEAFVNRAGDCTEHALLLAALCRAIGIPSRVVAGLVAHEDAFHGHLWTEVHVDRWRPLDATLADPRPDARRIPVFSSSLDSPGPWFAAVAAWLPRLEIETLPDPLPGTGAEDTDARGGARG